MWPSRCVKLDLAVKTETAKLCPPSSLAAEPKVLTPTPVKAATAKPAKAEAKTDQQSDPSRACASAPTPTEPEQISNAKGADTLRAFSICGPVRVRDSHLCLHRLRREPFRDVSRSVARSVRIVHVRRRDELTAEKTRAANAWRGGSG